MANDGEPGSAPDWVVARARERGAPPDAGYRVVVLGADARTTVHDFLLRQAALAYADDVASESDIPPSIAYVFDAQLRYVGSGRHYAARRNGALLALGVGRRRRWIIRAVSSPPHH